MLGFLPDFITREAPSFPDHVEIKHSARARRVSLRLNPKTRKFDLTIPQWMSLHEAHSFTQNNAQWMQTRLNKLAPTIPFTHGQTLPILGQERILTITPNPHSARTKITLSDTQLTMLTHLDNPAPRLEKFLKALAKETMSPKLHAKAAQIGKAVSALSLRDPKSRWGSCSEDGRIMLSWRLIFAPDAAMDYVIAHEVAHLIHLDHSPNFWALCQSLSDDFTQGSQWIRKHGNSLMRYG